MNQYETSRTSVSLPASSALQDTSQSARHVVEFHESLYSSDGMDFSDQNEYVGFSAEFEFAPGI